MQVLQERPLSIYEGVKSENRTFCGAFYRELSTASRDIHYVEPVLRTNDPEHPRLAKYAACQRYEGPRGEDIFSGIDVALGSHSLRMYRLDLDENPKNGLEEYLYGEEPRFSNEPRAQYVSINFTNCTFAERLSVEPENPTKPGFDAKGINALVRYRGRHFIYNLTSFGGDVYSGLSLWAYDRRERYFPSAAMCVWTVKR